MISPWLEFMSFLWNVWIQEFDEDIYSDFDLQQQCMAVSYPVGASERQG